MKLCADEYVAAADLRSRTEDFNSVRTSERNQAMSLFVRSRALTGLTERKAMLDESLHKLRAIDPSSVSDKVADVSTLQRLQVLSERMEIELDGRLREEFAKEGVEVGEKAIGTFQKRPQEIDNLVRAYLDCAYFSRHGAFAHDLDKKWCEIRRRNALEFLETASTLANETKDPSLVGESHCRLVETRFDLLGDMGSEMKERIEKFALPAARLCRDNRLIGDALIDIATCEQFQVETFENAEEIRKTRVSLLKLIEEGIERYNRIGYNSGISNALRISLPGLAAEQLLELEKDPLARENLLKKFRETSERSLKLAIESGYSDVEKMHLSLSHHLMRCAIYETDPQLKKELLQEASAHGEEGVKLLNQVSANALAEPADLNLGPAYFTEGSIKFQLAKLAKREDGDIRSLEKNNMVILLLKQAGENYRKTIELFRKHVVFAKSPDTYWLQSLARTYEELGKIYRESYSITRDGLEIVLSIEATEKAAKYYDDSGLASRSADCFWRIAESKDAAEDFSGASKAFSNAAKGFGSLSQSNPKLRELYDGYYNHMKAWVEIEDAKIAEKSENYVEASSHFLSAANFLSGTKKWNYLEPNFLAWASLEEAEDLSRAGIPTEAALKFTRARQLFEKAALAMNEELKSDHGEEELILKEFEAAVALRQEYCLGRLALEEARIAHKSGDQLKSANKFSFASETFKLIGSKSKSQLERSQVDQIAYLSKAWQKMVEAERLVDPGLYLEAANLFSASKEKTSSLKFGLLAAGHSYYCLAIQAAISFRQTGDSEFYSKAKLFMENASEYYDRAGLESEAVWAKASQRVFDAYVYMNMAQKEPNPDMRAKSYAMSERVLEIAAELYKKSGFPSKRDEVMRALRSVKVEKELALSLSQILSTSTLMTSTANFSIPVSTSRAPIGLESLERAEIQSTIVVERKELQVGEDLDLGLAFVNAGRAPALILRVEDLIPSGFDIVSKPERYSINDNGIDLKGKRIEPLKRDELPFSIRARRAGEFSLKPRIVFVDEKGQYRTDEPEPVMIAVSEIGSLDWEHRRRDGISSELPNESNERSGGQRRLAAIMFTDLVGYTSLAQRDENLALDLLEHHRELLRPLFPRHNGREVKTMGDAFLVEFLSALEAVQCAFDIQQLLHRLGSSGNAALVTVLRIGIHVGDVVHKNDDVFGDAVNVASRIEPLSSPGGICISQQVYDHVRNKFEFPIVSVGSKLLKNVEIPIQVYKVELPWDKREDS